LRISGFWAGSMAMDCSCAGSRWALSFFCT
jgi:hypothetical protein